MTQRDADRRSGTWLTCWECGDWYGPLSETVKREGSPETCPLTGDEVRPAPPPKLWPACPKCGGGVPMTRHTPNDFKQIMALGDKIMAERQRAQAGELLGGLVLRAITIIETARADSDNPEVYEIILETLTPPMGGLAPKLGAVLGLYIQLSQTVDFMMDDPDVDHCGLMGLRVDMITTLLQTMGDSGQ